MNNDQTLDFLADLERELDKVQPSDNDSIVPPGERECPICKQKMAVEQEDLVTIDVCHQHGIWLDDGELRKIISNVRTGSLINQRAAVDRARKEGRMQGLRFGGWSLLMD